MQELTSSNLSVVSWKERNSEIEFLKQSSDGKIVPIEVKAGSRTQAKSLAQYILKYNPDTAVIASAKPLKIDPDKTIQKIPLYLIGKIEEILDAQ